MSKPYSTLQYENSPDLSSNLVDTLLTDDLFPLRVDREKVSLTGNETTELHFDNKIDHRRNTLFRCFGLSRHDECKLG